MFFLRLAGTFEVATSYLSLSGCEWRRRPVNDSIPSHPHDTHTHTPRNRKASHSLVLGIEDFVVAVCSVYHGFDGVEVCLFFVSHSL